MTRLRREYILYLVFLAPYGIGISGFGLFNSFDGPKLGMVLALISVITALIDLRWQKHMVLFTMLVILHLLSAIYISEYNGIRDFVFVGMCGYVGGFFAATCRNQERLIRVFKNILIISVVLSIFEFVLQYNFLDSYRNIYLNNNDLRFNSELGMIRLGLKASMGTYASTLPFAYNTFIIYAFLRLERKGNLSFIWRLLSFVAICFTLCRAVILIFIFFELIMSHKKLKEIGLIIVFGISAFLLIGKDYRAQEYISKYIYSIFKNEEKHGAKTRIDSNLTDLDVLDGWGYLVGRGAGTLEAMKQGIAKQSDLASSDTGILIYTIVDRGLISFLILLILYLKLSIYFFYKKCRLPQYLIPFIGLVLLSISFRYEVLFISYFFLIYYNERCRLS